MPTTKKSARTQESTSGGLVATGIELSADTVQDALTSVFGLTDEARELTTTAVRSVLETSQNLTNGGYRLCLSGVSQVDALGATITRRSLTMSQATVNQFRRVLLGATQLVSDTAAEVTGPSASKAKAA